MSFPCVYSGIDRATSRKVFIRNSRFTLHGHSTKEVKQDESPIFHESRLHPSWFSSVITHYSETFLQRKHFTRSEIFTWKFHDRYLRFYPPLFALSQRSSLTFTPPFFSVSFSLPLAPIFSQTHTHVRAHIPPHLSLFFFLFFSPLFLLELWISTVSSSILSRIHSFFSFLSPSLFLSRFPYLSTSFPRSMTIGETGGRCQYVHLVLFPYHFLVSIRRVTETREFPGRFDPKYTFILSFFYFATVEKRYEYYFFFANSECFYPFLPWSLRLRPV